MERLAVLCILIGWKFGKPVLQCSQITKLFAYCKRPRLLALKPNDLWKKEKSLSLEPLRGILYKTYQAKQGVKKSHWCQISPLKSLKKFAKNSADKIQSKKDKDIKVSLLMSIRVKKQCSSSSFLHTFKVDVQVRNDHGYSTG